MPAIDPATQKRLDPLVGKYGRDLTAESVHVARRKNDPIVVRSHADVAVRHLEYANLGRVDHVGYHVGLTAHQ